MLCRHESRHRASAHKSTSGKTTVQDREKFLALPLAERRKIMRKQAKQLLATYTGNQEISGMGGGDFVDY